MSHSLPPPAPRDTHELRRELTLYATAPPGTRVLLAEDDPDLRSLLTACLRRAGYAVLPLAGGHEALAMFSAASIGSQPLPDAIVMDIRMPSHSGLELLMALRLAEWRVPVILVTGFGDEVTHQRAADYGAFALLDKPLRSEQLLAEVTRAIASTIPSRNPSAA